MTPITVTITSAPSEVEWGQPTAWQRLSELRALIAAVKSPGSRPLSMGETVDLLLRHVDVEAFLARYALHIRPVVAGEKK